MVKILSKYVLVCFVFSMIIGPVFAETTTSEASEQKAFISAETTTSEASEQKTFLSAETRVERLAFESETDRKSAGSVAGLLGMLMTFIGVTNQSNQDFSDSDKAFYTGTGLLLMAIGAFYYFIPTGIEKDYVKIDKVDKTTAEGVRELLAEKSLKDRSADAARGRMWGSIIWAGLSAAYQTSGAESRLWMGSVLCGAMALYTWFNRSEVEKEYEEYMGDKELLKKELSVTPVTNEGTMIEAK